MCENMRAYDLFCGAGGASNAIRDHGFNVTGFDNWGDACMTQNANGHDVVLADLFEHEWGDEQVDFIWASPPCQPFTKDGNRLGKNDERDGMPAFIRALREVRPPVFIMENVKGLVSDRTLNGYLQENLDHMKDLGYHLQFRVIDAADFGIPQRRERLFIVGSQNKLCFEWPKPTVEKHVTLAEAMGWNIDDLVGFPRKYDGRGKDFYGYRARDLINCDRPAHTVTSKCRSLSRWNKDGTCHRITVEEIAKLQDFPEGYVFIGSQTSQYTQIANAVPYRMAKVMLDAVFPDMAKAPVQSGALAGS